MVAECSFPGALTGSFSLNSAGLGWGWGVGGGCELLGALHLGECSLVLRLREKPAAQMVLPP